MPKYMLLMASLSVCAGLSGGIPTAAEAAQLTIRQAVAACPDFQGAKACRSVARTFLTGRQPGASTDAQIANLVLSISHALESRSAPPVVCRDAARGVRVLADGVADSSAARELRQLASDLCLDQHARQKTDPFQVPQSLSSGRPKLRQQGDIARGDDLAGDDLAGDDVAGDDVAGDDAVAE